MLGDPTYCCICGRPARVDYSEILDKSYGFDLRVEAGFCRWHKAAQTRRKRANAAAPTSQPPPPNAP